MSDILILGGGVGGLTLALVLHQNGLPCRIVEAAPDIRPLGVGVNVLPHGAAEDQDVGHGFLRFWRGVWSRAAARQSARIFAAATTSRISATSRFSSAAKSGWLIGAGMVPSRASAAA
jgi:2-polyprenyl-6-methoxyphenol hydroxylase-like FAD-dependent oxidoreductase